MKSDKRFFMHSRFLMVLAILCFLVATLPGCETGPTYEKSYKVLSGSKVTMEALGTMAKDLHKQGVLSDEQIAEAEKAYNAAKDVQLEFINAQTEALLSGDSSKQEQVARIGVAYLAAATRFINLAIQYGIIKSDDPSIQKV